MFKRVNRGLFALLFSLFLLLAGCSSEESSSSEGSANNGNDEQTGTEQGTIKIGAVLPMTGGSAVFGEKFEQAYTLAIEEINEAGGVKGRMLEIVIEDSQEKPDIGKTATEKLVADEEILIMTGGRSSGVTLVQAQVAEENKVPYIIDHGTSDLATMSGYEYVFRMNPTSGMYVTALKDYLRKNPPEFIVHVNVDNAFGEALYEYGLKDFIAETGFGYEQLKYAAGELDLKPVMEAAKSFNPDIVLMTAGDDNDATQLIKAAYEVDLNPKLFIGTGAGHSIIGFYEQAGELAETVLTAGPWHGDKNHPDYQKFFDKFTERYGHEPGEHEVEGYAVMYVIADVLERAENLDRESVRKAIEETDLYTVFGHVKFEDFDGYTNQNRAVTNIAQWINGKLVTVYPEEYAEQEIIFFPGWNR